MKFWLINSLRTVTYVAYFAIIIYSVWIGFHNKGRVAMDLNMTTDSALAPLLDIIFFSVVGFLSATIICGLIMTIMDIRDDINDRLPDAHHDD